MAALFLVGIVAAAGAVSAFGGMFRNSETEQALEQNDFAAWKTAIESELTEENFQEMVTRHNGRGTMKGLTEEDHEERESFRTAMQSGDYSAYLAAAETLGLEKTLTEEEFAIVTEFHGTHDNEAMRTQGALRQAVAEADYDAYVDAAETLGAESILSEDEFNTLVELHQSGSMGIGFGPGMGNGMDRGMGEGLGMGEGRTSRRMMPAE